MSSSPIVIRQAVPGDEHGMARVRVDTWRSAYRGLIPDDYLASLDYDEVARRWRDILFSQPGWSPFGYVAEDAQGGIIGIAIAGLERTGDPLYQGQIYVLYVLHEYQGRGIGRQLVSACARKLLDHGVQGLLIYVLAENPYRRFYESIGGAAVREKQEETGGITATEIGYGWTDIRPLILEPE